MRKNTTFEIILTVILLLLCVYTALKAYNLKQRIEYVTDTVTDTVTLTDIQFDTVVLTHIVLDTLTLHDSAFFFDTVNNTTYVQVEVPIYSHIIDTNIDSNIHLYEQISGYRVTLDTMALELKPTIIQIQPERKFRVMPAIGVGYGTSGVGLFGGVGISYW